MVTFPFCKINLGLHVLARRQDGYHTIETCFFPVPWTDVLEIVPAARFRFRGSGLSIPGSDDSNSCVTAWRRLATDFGIPPVEILLHKVIPTGAGLGGGSADAAFALRSLNELFSLHLSPAQLTGYAAELGSDCAYFLEDKPMIGTGRGEILSPVTVTLNGKYLVIVKPDIHVPTAEAYKGITPATPKMPLSQILRLPLGEWKEKLVNDFEPSVFRKYPAIAAVKEKLYSLGAAYASMSGSGAAVFALFEKETDVGDIFPGEERFEAIINN